MYFVEQEFTVEYIPKTIREQFIQLYDLSSKMKQDIDNEKVFGYEKDLKDAFEEGDYEIQWQLLETMRKMKTHPTNNIITYLNDKQIHPVIKTSIFHWLHQLKDHRVLKINKLNEKIDVIPMDIRSKT